jgi:hypothetical protein
VSAIQPQMDTHYKRSPYSNDDLQNFAIPGFLWESAMERAEQLEHILSYEGLIAERRLRNLVHSPGEMFWCRSCDEVMSGLDIAAEHQGLPTSEDPEYDYSEGDEYRTDHLGIFWTPDARDDEFEPRCRPEEFKVTWVSANRTSETTLEIWKYLTQTQWQAWGYGTEYAAITSLFVNGDYTYPLTPKTYRFEIEYLPKEIRNNHSMIVSNAIAKGWI